MEGSLAFKAYYLVLVLWTVAYAIWAHHSDYRTRKRGRKVSKLSRGVTWAMTVGAVAFALVYVLTLLGVL